MANTVFALSAVKAEGMSAADSALETARLNVESCKGAVSEQVVDCLAELSDAADTRLKEQMCAYEPTVCLTAFREFEEGRRKIVDAFLSAIDEPSVVARIDAALLYLEVTLDYEEAGAFSRRPHLKRTERE